MSLRFILVLLLCCFQAMLQGEPIGFQPRAAAKEDSQVEEKALRAFLAERRARDAVSQPIERRQASKELPLDVAMVPADYFLPDDHPTKAFLDKVFSKPDALASLKDLEKLGFMKPKQRKRGVVVGFHPALDRYLLKMYLDTFQVDELEQWVRRIEGARLVQQCLDDYQYNDIMKVPRKWIYALPDTPSSKRTNSPFKKKYILVVENMEIYSDQETWQLYRTAVQPFHLDALFDVLVDCKLVDSTWILNIPFSYDGRIAFVDTEFAGKSLIIWVRLPNLAKYLSTEMSDYWFDLIRSRCGYKAA